MRLKKAAREVKAKQAEADASKEQVAPLAAQVEHLERSVAKATERLSETSQTKMIKDEAASRAIAALSSELAGLQTRLATLTAARDAGEARRSELEAEVRAAAEVNERETREMVTAMKGIQRAIAEYHARLYKQMAEVTAAGAGAGVGAGGGTVAAMGAAAAAGVGAGSASGV